MTSVLIPVRAAADLVRDQQFGPSAWRRDVTRRMARDPQAESDREGQMDARRRLAAVRRTSSAIQACQVRRARGLAPSVERPRAVVVHRNEWMRVRLAEEFDKRGISAIGEGEDGAVAVAMAVVEQPELLVLEDRLPWVTAREVVQQVRQFAPRTVVVVQLRDSAEAADMLAAGATSVVSRGLLPAELCECCAHVLVNEALEVTA